MKRAVKTALRPAYNFAKRLLADGPQVPRPTRLSPDDEMLMWMRYVIPGWLRPSNIELFMYCIENLPSGNPIIEIGSFAGMSLNHLIYFLRCEDRKNLVYSVDGWTFEGSRPGPITAKVPLTFEQYRTHVINTFRGNMMTFCPDRLPHHIELSSGAFFAAWEKHQRMTDFFGRDVVLGGPVSLAYIDGDHTYAESHRDFQNVDRHLDVGGFIIFDDSEDSSGWGSNRTAKEAAQLSHYELTARNPNYCIRKIR